jgi:hypothetical protein
MRNGILLLFLLIINCGVYAQYLNGRTRNEAGGAASRVNVHFTNSVNKVITDEEGNFRILAKNLPDTLVFSSEGTEPYKLLVTEKSLRDPSFEVVLLNKRPPAPDPSLMEEVVVTSVDVRKPKRDLSYATTKISGDELSGKVAGLSVGTGYDDRSTSRRTAGGRNIAVAVDDRYYFKDTNIFNGSYQKAASRLLTAGEVNDFNKWKMWEDFSAADFKGYSRFWGMHTTKRYTVQLTDKGFNAVVNSPVYLINSNTRDTAWKAYTDNTGKAELWAEFLQDTVVAGNYYIADAHGNVFRSISGFSNGINLLTVAGNCNVSNEVDIAFVVDATGSMGDEIEFLKLELEDVIRGTMEKHSKLNLRAASVFYRDSGDQYVTQHVDFSEDLLKAINFIKLQKAGGGGDYPEAVDAALSTALDSLSWNSNARTRLLFLVLDAPPHNEAKERIQRLVERAASLGIRIVPIACSGTDKQTEFLLRTMALATNGTYSFLTNNSGIGNAHIEPTTDKYEIELLGSLLKRVIGEFVFAKDCNVETKTEPDIPVPDNILSLKIYPNPTSGKFVIETEKDIQEIFIADFTGKILMRIMAGDKKGKWNVDLGQYPSGTYLVRYITRENKWRSGKVVLIRN